jgi:hypothetical protein
LKRIDFLKVPINGVDHDALEPVLQAIEPLQR